MTTKFIAIEGVDSVGKETQTKLLKEWLGTFLDSKNIHTYSYPDYSSKTGKLVRSYLNGEFGDAVTMDPRLSGALYSLDRVKAKGEFDNLIGAGDQVVLLDRYVHSNCALQGAKIEEAAEREAFYRHCESLEFLDLGLPRPDMIIFLDADPETAQELMKKRTGQDRDQHESNLPFLKAAHRNYKELATDDSWVTIPCIAGGEMRSIEAISLNIRAAVKQLF
ncbi:thymidylate kinase [Vibrio phage BONAISHI]|nr:thymidylate kinase [Vibrio phage BONAISHI]